MELNKSFDITEVAGEYIAIPVKEMALSLNGVITLNEEAALLLKFMNQPRTYSEMVDYLVAEYEIDRPSAERDIKAFVTKMLEIGLIVE